MEIGHSRLLKYLMDPKMSKTIHKLEFEVLNPTSIESEVPGQQKIREAAHDIAKPSDTPLSQAETVEYDMDSYVPVITQTKETENRKEPRNVGVFKVENPMYSCIHGELVAGPHIIREVTDEDKQQKERRDNGEKKTSNHQDNKKEREEVIKADIEGDQNEDLLDKKKEDMHGEEKKPKTRIPISKFKQAAESITEQRRAIKNEKTPESKPLNKESRVQQSSIPKLHHTGAPNKPPRLSIEKNKISPKVSHPKTLNEKIDTSKKHIKSEVDNKTDDKILKIPALSKPVTNTVNKPQISDNVQLKNEFKKHEIDSGIILKPNESESNMNNKIKPSEEKVEMHIDNQLNENILTTDDVEKIQVEDEFEKLYEEIVDLAEVNLDNSLLNNKIDDTEKIENKFEDIIHAYDDPDHLEAEGVNIKSKIPQLKRRSEHEIIVPAQIRRLSLKNPPSVEKGKVHNPFKRSTNQTEVKKEIPKPKPIKKESETPKEKILSRLPFLRKVKEPKKEDIKEKQLDGDLSQPKDIKNKPKESLNTKELHTEPKNIIEETIHIRDFRQPKLRENEPDIVETKIEEETRNVEKYEEPVKEHFKSHHNVEDEEGQKRPRKEIETVNQDKGHDKFEQIPVEKLEVNYGIPHDFQDEGKNIQNEDVDTVISFNPVENANTIEFDSHPENNNDEERNVDPANENELQHKPSTHENEVEKLPIHTTKVHLPDTKHLPELEDKPKTEPILKTEMVENILEWNNIEEPKKHETIKKAQEINKKINHDHQENTKERKVPKEVNKESTTPETGNIEYIHPEETIILNRTEKPQQMPLLNKKEPFEERVQENEDEVLIINKEDIKENICEKQDKTKEISIVLHKKEINEDADKEREELNEGSFLNKKENVHEEFTKENKHLDDEEVPSLKGKVSNIINKIHSNNLAHVEIKKEEPKEEKPKKRSILSKIAMFEHKDSSAPVQKRTLPQHKDTKTPTYHIEVVDINKPVDKPSVVGEVLKPIQREPILKQEIHQDANAIKTVDTMQNDFEQPKQLLIIEDIRQHTSIICDNKNYESDIIIKENVSELHDNHSVINKETKDKVKPIKTETIPKTEKMKITSILKSKDLNSNPSRHKFKQDNKELNTPKKVEKLPSLESVEKNPRKQDPKIFIPEKTDEKLNKDFKPNTPPLQSTMQIDEKPAKPEINKLPNEKEGHILEKQKDNLDNESLNNDVFDNKKTDNEVEIINVVHRKPKKREERPKSVAEIDLGDAVKGIVHKMIVRMNSTELLNVEKKEIINAKERPRKKSVSEKIELFEKKLTPVEIKGVKNRETHAKPTLNSFQDEKRISQDECERIINDLKNAKLNYGRVTEMVYLDFNNGHTIPVLNIGTALLDKRLIPHVIGAAIDLGYRGIDTAYVYGNEKEVGEAIQAKINDGTVKREDLFITSKLWNTYHRPDLVTKACRSSLQAMGLEYFDLYLVHSPMSFKEGKDPIPKIANVIQYSAFDYMNAWYAMEELVGEGLVRSIGVSNFNSVQIARVVEKSRIKPVVNQVECHPYLSQRNLDEFCNARDVMLSCFGTLGSKGTPDHLKTLLQPVIDDPLVKVMAAGLNVTPAQMLIRYQIENRRTVVVKATKADHLWSNLQTLNMSLDSRQIDALDALNRNKRTYDFKGMGSTHKNYPFNRPF